MHLSVPNASIGAARFSLDGGFPLHTIGCIPKNPRREAPERKRTKKPKSPTTRGGEAAEI
eukprot:3285124-Amphidinium_carterae.2